jgi:putative MATE family efflux protein
MTRSHRRQILEIAVPVSIESSFQLFVGFVNQVIIASLGTVAIAAVGLANNLLFIGVLTLSALGSGTGILVSQARGRDDQHAITRLAWVGVLLATVLGTVVAAPLVISSSGFLSAIGTDPAVVASASGYLALVAATLPFIAISSVATMVFRSIGQVRLPMVVAIATGLLSPGFSWVFVHVADLGEPGAGIGLLVAQALKAVILVGFLAGRRRGIGFAAPTFAIAKAESRAMVPLVMPLFITEIVFSSGVFLYALLFGRIGTEALAVFQIVTTIEGVFIVGALGFHSASTVLVARAVGGGVEADVWFWAKAIWRLALKTALGLGLLYVAMIPLLGLLYPNTSDQVRTWTAVGILLNALFLPVKVSNILCFGTLSSGGDTRYLLLSDVVTVGVVGLPLAYLLGVTFGFGLWGVFAARLLGEELSRITMLGLRFRSGRWFDLSSTDVEPATALPA